MIQALLLAAATAAAPDCSAAALARDAAPVAALRARLAAAAPRDDIDTDVPESARADLDAYKDELGNLVARAVDCLPPRAATEEVERDVAKLLPDIEGKGYATSVEVAASRNDGWLAVVTRSSIQCGEDAALAVFEPRGGRWQERLRWHSKPYDKVSGAYGSFQFKISPRDAHGDWFAVAAHVHPWCSSTWSSIGYEALRPGATPVEPRVLLAEDHSMWWGGDDFGEITVEPDAFELRYTAESIDAGLHSRTHVRHYAVRGDTVERTAPVALAARDFVDEWIVSEWKDARAWSDGAAAPRLADLHAKLGPPHERWTPMDFVSEKSCGPGGFEIAWTTRDDHVVYFRVRQGDTFLLVDAGDAPFAGCFDADETP